MSGFLGSVGMTRGVRFGLDVAPDFPQVKALFRAGAADPALSIPRFAHTSRIGPGYFATAGSPVTKVTLSTIAWATSIRSNGSR